MKLFWKILSSFLASLLSIILVFALLLLPVISFLTDHSNPNRIVDIFASSDLFTQPDNPTAGDRPILLSNGAVADVPENLDFEALMETLQELSESGVIDVEQLVKDLEIPTDIEIDQERMMQELSESKAVQTLLTTYADDILRSASGTGDAPLLTADTVMDILAPHMDEIVTIVESNLPNEVNIDREKLTNAIDKAAEAALPSLIETLPPAQEVADALVSSNEALSALLRFLGFVRNGQLRLIAIGVVALLVVLVFLLRLPGFNGLRWVGISGLVAAVFAGGLSYLLQAKTLTSSLASSLSDFSSLAMPLLSSLASTFVTCAIIYGIVGLVLVIANGVLNYAFAKA